MRKRRDFVVLAIAALLLVATAASAGATTLLPRAAGRPSGTAVASGRPALPKPIPSPVYSSAWLEAHPGPDLGVGAAGGIVVDLDTQAVLWARSPDAQRAPASLAKLMTAMIAADLAPLDQEVTVPVEATRVEPNLMGLAAGDVVSVRSLLYGLFLLSGNDSAETLARSLEPRDQFIARMNARATELGLRHTHFSNPSGLDDPDLYSSPYDLALIAGRISTLYPELMAIASTKAQFIQASDHHHAYDIYNLNKLLWTYPGANGLKTGFTDDAGGCVVVTATRNGRHLLVVVLHSDTFFTEAARLLDYGFTVNPN